MELPGSVATLSMKFAGFCAIVIVLRQSIGKEIAALPAVAIVFPFQTHLIGCGKADPFCPALPPILLFIHVGVLVAEERDSVV